MIRSRSWSNALLCLSFTAMFVALPAKAQQVTGTPGSPSATTPVSAKQLPACRQRARRTCC